MKLLTLFLILALFCFDVPSVFAFTDLTLVDDEEAIEYLYDEGIVEGYDDETYRPSHSINRAELLKILVESREGHVSSDEKNCFTDVTDEWYAKYVCVAKDEGWIEGYGDGNFRPGDFINRAEALAMVFKVYAEEVELLDADEETLYVDVPTDVWYSTYLYTAMFLGVLDEESYFYPSNEITRGDTATILYRLLVSLSSDPSEPSVEASLYVDPSSNAYDQIEEWGDTEEAQDLLQIAEQPTAKWFGDWTEDIESAVDDYVDTVTEAGDLPVMVIYNIPGRDCGSYSAGGSSDEAAYVEWVQAFADGVGSREAWVIVEPDALALDCLYESSTELIAEAVTILKSQSGISVYLDAGHPNWNSASTMADRLTDANVEEADGFALNVSNFYTTEENIEYGEELSALIGEKHFIVDTSRNGNGSNEEWCNPSGRSLGQAPTVETGEELVDAYLWVKPPGESDGTCNGGPSAGSWWPEYALDLVRN